MLKLNNAHQLATSDVDPRPDPLSYRSQVLLSSDLSHATRKRLRSQSLSKKTRIRLGSPTDQQITHIFHSLHRLTDSTSSHPSSRLSISLIILLETSPRTLRNFYKRTKSYPTPGKNANPLPRMAIIHQSSALRSPSLYRSRNIPACIILFVKRTVLSDIVPNDRPVFYYTRHVREYNMTSETMNGLMQKNPATPYELADLPSTQLLKTPDQNSRILHQTQKAPTSTKLASHILYFRASYLRPSLPASRTLAPRIRISLLSWPRICGIWTHTRRLYPPAPRISPSPPPRISVASVSSPPPALILSPPPYLTPSYSRCLITSRLLASSLRETDESFLTIVPDDRAVLYYTRHIRDIQYDLRDNEWAKFKKNPAAPYELADLPSNPATEDSDTQKAPTSTKLAFRISRLVSRTSYSHASYLAPRTLAPRISHLVPSLLASHISYFHTSYLTPRTLVPHTSRLVPLRLVSRVSFTKDSYFSFLQIHRVLRPDVPLPLCTQVPMYQICRLLAKGKPLFSLSSLFII
ncbi:hypothetical protein BS47DRAFT_1402370 [Hydnum rufescens UP504]|uniref:Uncharacterized protein n=1 Tax=Hydnum rufescens UP504 TaxID=1448309 RepID=A0A9P6AEK0_9AGAM|nr:hypothetical protein BS47DRAFT_1402370 [Hydnum rufescens UP504]